MLAIFAFDTNFQKVLQLGSLLYICIILETLKSLGVEIIGILMIQLLFLLTYSIAIYKVWRLG